MEILTYEHPTIRGSIMGKLVLCTLRGSPDGLQLPAGNYLLRPAQNNPVYGLVMAIEPQGGGPGVPAIDKGKAPSHYILKRPADASAAKFTNPAITKNIPGGAAPAIKFDTAAPAIKFDTAAPAIKFDTAAPAIKFDAPAAWLAKFDFPTSQLAPIVIAERAIAGNCLVAMQGFGDLVDAVRLAVGVTLVVR